MESLIASLTDNALCHNVPGGWAEISTVTSGGLAVVSVRNTGPAIPPGEVDRLFQPFQRLGTERFQRTGGHGLGLAIVSAIADAHGASVTGRTGELPVPAIMWFRSSVALVLPVTEPQPCAASGWLSRRWLPLGSRTAASRTP